MKNGEASGEGRPGRGKRVWVTPKTIIFLVCAQITLLYCRVPRKKILNINKQMNQARQQAQMRRRLRNTIDMFGEKNHQPGLIVASLSLSLSLVTPRLPELFSESGPVFSLLKRPCLPRRRGRGVLAGPAAFSCDLSSLSFRPQGETCIAGSTEISLRCAHRNDSTVDRGFSPASLHVFRRLCRPPHQPGSDPAHQGEMP